MDLDGDFRDEGKHVLDLPFVELAELIAKPAPVPGGGSVSALCGALGAASAEMAGRLALKKCDDASVGKAIVEHCQGLSDSRSDLLSLAQKDCEAFDSYISALNLPKGTEGERNLRRIAMENNLRLAADCPLDTASKAVVCLELALFLVDRVSPSCISDVLVGAVALRAAALGALFNVRINLRSIKDEKFRQKTLSEAKMLETSAMRLESEIIERGRRIIDERIKK